MSDQNDQHAPTNDSEEAHPSDFESAQQPKQVLLTDEELKKLQHESMDYKDKYLRSLAEQENARKRLQKERQDISRYATESLIADFLRPIDNLENALNLAKAMSDEVRNWATGFQMILTQFKDILSLNGVTPIESKGQPFDPHYHEAIEMIITDEYPPGIVIEECMRGYKVGERTLRPSRVKVSKAVEANKEETQEENQE